MNPVSPTRFTRKAFFAGIRGGLPIVPVANEQIRAQPYAFPADEHEQIVVRQDQDEHGGHEQVQVGKEAVIAGVPVHIAGRVDVHEEADTTDDKQHDGTQCINLKRHIGREGTGKNPGIEFGFDRLTRVHHEAENHDQGTHQGSTDRTHPKDVRLVANSQAPQETVEEYSEGWKNRDQPD